MMPKMICIMSMDIKKKKVIGTNGTNMNKTFFHCKDNMTML